MTREEAIEVLNGILKLNYREWWNHKCDEAIDMAIEALSTPSGDIISRADAIETIMSEPMNEPKYPIWFADKLKELPSADADTYTRITGLLPDAVSRKGTVTLNSPISIQAEMVAVVRCKDCIYGEERIGEYRCHMLDEDWDIRFPSTHYCAYGERREL